MNNIINLQTSNLLTGQILLPIVTIGLNNDGFFGAGFGINNFVNGEGGNDTINTIFGLNDIINGGSGDDSAITGDGDDIVNGGSGSDFVLAGAGNDLVDGGSGDDFLFGDDVTTNPGNDVIRGGTGNDFIDAQGGDDTVYGGRGFDRITGEQGADLIFGNGSHDILTGAEGNDTLYGGRGDDAVFGFADNDLVFGDKGNDVLSGGTGNDLVFGGEGNDTLIGFDVFSPQPLVVAGEVDTLTGGSGDDVFALGGTLPGGNLAVFYTTGVEDYAVVNDFESGDRIQLVGSSSDYSLAAFSADLPTGTAIYYNDDMIGVVADVSPQQFNLDNSTQFIFV